MKGRIRWFGTVIKLLNACVQPSIVQRVRLISVGEFVSPQILWSFKRLEFSSFCMRWGGGGSFNVNEKQKSFNCQLATGEAEKEGRTYVHLSVFV